MPASPAAATAAITAVAATPAAPAASAPAPGSLAAAVIGWQRRCGRHGLPWQGTRDPYRVWLSEIMLQQTQVATVLAYYPRFLARFPTVAALAAAAQDEVLGLWSGLGYYSRARNLHRCAQQVMAHHGGRFPRTAQELQTLPGIGPSTAAAIAAFCFGQRAAILDGNVKRVLTRVFGIADDLSQPAHERALWQRAQALLPTHDLPRAMPAYTQGLMDLGATVCTRTRPNCTACPLHGRCLAAAQGQPERYPVKTRRSRRQPQSLWLLHLLPPAPATPDTATPTAAPPAWLEKRPPQGIWASLYCLPCFDSRQALLDSAPLHLLAEHPPLPHALTHRDLLLHIITARWQTPPPAAAQPAPGAASTPAWHPAAAWPALGLPAPVRRFLTQQAQAAQRIKKDSNL